MLALAAALAVPGCGRATDAPPVATSSAAPDPYGDDRIAQWMSGCAHTHAFLEDTSDPIPVLVSKLAAGEVDPLRNARVELAASGAAALPELQRLFDACWSEPMLAQRVQNVVEVAGMMETGAGRGLILRALDHPSPSVRETAARALTRHARPEDYDLLLERMPRSGRGPQGDFVLALLAADPVRAARDLAAWIQDETMAEAARILAPHVVGLRDPDAAAALRPIYPALEGELRVHVQTFVAAQPDEEALAGLRAWLLDESDPTRRHLVAGAFSRAGLAHELSTLVTTTDPDPVLRKIAVQAIAAAPDGETMRETLRTALADPDPDVRDVALSALAARGDALAIDAALQALTGSRAEHEPAIRALQLPMARDPSLAARVLETLVALRANETGRGLVDEITILRSIGNVPLEDAARTLMDVARTATGEIQGQRAHRWLTTIAGNTGSAGMAYLRSLWAEESDPVRRMDLVVGGTSEKSPLTRAFLAEVAESPRSTPPEVLHAAARLARFGPARDAAPILKRVALRIDDARVRPALNCLLWTWYGKSA